MAKPGNPEQISQRKRWLETLLDRMTAPADVMRQHLAAESQNTTLGAAAEAGVRDLVRLVLPQRMAVTSGFLRNPGSNLAAPGSEGDISPQTDVIIYDQSWATPLHGIGGVEIVAAPDVLGVIEVKDKKNGSGSLSEKDKGALDHVRQFSAYSSTAFRGIVLFRGNDDKDDEVDYARGLIDGEKLTVTEVPHVVYCSAYRKNGENCGYVAFFDFFARRIFIRGYRGDRTSALAAFLRLFTGFLACQNLISPSLYFDLVPENHSDEQTVDPVVDGDNSFTSLHNELADRRDKNPATFDRLFVEMLGENESVETNAHVTTGRDDKGQPTAGFIILVTRHEPEKNRLAAFFYLVAPGEFQCTDAPGKQAWNIREKFLPDYLRRAWSERDREQKPPHPAPTHQGGPAAALEETEKNEEKIG